MGPPAAPEPPGQVEEVDAILEVAVHEHDRHVAAAGAHSAEKNWNQSSRG